jgi:hypothetical protein
MCLLGKRSYFCQKDKINLLKKSLTNYIVLIGVHLSLLFTLYIIFSFLELIKGFPTNGSVFQWDVAWYKSIKDHGYFFNKGEQSNVAFFPLFPLIWKHTFLSPIGISIVNIVFLYAGVFLLNRTYNLDSKKTLLILSVPSLFFCYIPYSEALFFLAGSLIIYGLKKDNWIALVGISLACLTRSTSLIFIPILLFSKFYNYRLEKNNRKIFIETALLIFFTITSTLLAQYIQYLDTGIFFTIFKAQEAWHRMLRIPALYFTTWDEARLIWLDGLAFLVGVSSFVLCCILIVKKIIHKRKSISSDYLFSIAYLALVTIVTMLFSAISPKGETSLCSLNRYIFSSPFFMTFLIVLLKRNRINKNQILLFISISIFTWLLFNVHGYLQNLEKFSLPYFKTKLYFGIVFLYSLLYMLLSNKNYNNFIWSGVYLFNLIIQIYLFNRFLNGIWIG